METDKIKQRNEEYLQDFFQRYKLNMKFEDLDFSADNRGAPDKITSIYINFKEWSFQVYGNRRTLVHEEGDTHSKTKVKMKKVLIYNFSTRKIDQLDMEEIYQVRADFIRFVLMFNQLKKITEFDKEERQIEQADEIATFHMLSSLS